MPPPIAATLIADRGELVDVLQALRHGHWLVRVGDDAHGVTVDGAPVRHSFDVLWQYRLIDEVHNPDGFPGVRYYRINQRGRDFGARAWVTWRERPWWQRLVLRLTG